LAPLDKETSIIERRFTMAEDTQVIDPATGKPVATPSPAPVLNPDPAAELAELRRKNEELGKQVSDKESYISNLKAEKETLETRFSEINRPPAQPAGQPTGDIEAQAKSILEKAQIDPEAAGKDLANLIRSTTNAAQQSVLQNLQPVIENNTYAAEIKSKNKDLMEHFGERALSIEVAASMEKGKPFKDAVDTVVKEFRGRYDSLKSNAAPKPPPPGSQGEDGANKPPVPPPPVPELTQEDEIAARQEARRKRGLG
jgi:hypothetical protein